MQLGRPKKKAIYKIKNNQSGHIHSQTIFNAEVCKATPPQSSRRESIIQLLDLAKWLHKCKGPSMVNSVEHEGIKEYVLENLWQKNWQ